MIISLIGYMASGKTTLGKELAKKLNFTFLDLDKSIEIQEGKSVKEIINSKGELYFRKVEREQLNKVLRENKIVLSTGGGTPCYYNNMDSLNNKSTSIYLDVSIRELTKRLKSNLAERPLVSHLKENEIQEFVAKHLFERRPFYSQAKKHISSDQIEVKDLEKTINEIE